MKDVKWFLLMGKKATDRKVWLSMEKDVTLIDGKGWLGWKRVLLEMRKVGV